jgi:hypothetical protein
MDPRTNPYAPGAGTPPPELAGRSRLISDAAVRLDRIRAGLSAKSMLMVGLRGVGKTVLLSRIRFEAEARGIITVNIESPEQSSLPALLTPQLRASVLKLDRIKNVGDKAQRALRALGSFVKAAKLNYKDIACNIELETEPGVGV